MIFYKDDSTLPMKVIDTVNGEKEYRRNCRLIGDEYHVMNKDCFLVNGTWYRTNTGKIVKNHTTGEWVLANDPNIKFGVVEFQEGRPIEGYFTPDPNNLCKIKDGIDHGSKICWSVEAALENGYIDSVSGSMYKKENLTSANLRSVNTIARTAHPDHKGYNIEDNEDEFEEKKKTYVRYVPEYTKDMYGYAKLLGNITWGTELETSQGKVPDYLQYRLGLVECRDGSIGGSEFVSIPMQGVRGLWNVNKTGAELSRRCNIDINCSYHIHIGTLPKEKAYLVSLYRLCYLIQDEIFKMFPYFKTEPQGIKRKNYCQKLKRLSIYNLVGNTKEDYESYIDDAYTKIFTFLSDGIPPDADWNRQRMEHPIKAKWERPSRYVWANLQNMLFSPRQTFENRLHTATLNPTKCLLWLFISAAIVKYAEANQGEILRTDSPISIKKIFNYYKDNCPGPYATKMSDLLNAYYEDRCRIFKVDYDNGDYVSSHDLENDKKFIFKFEGKNNIV